MRDLQAAEAAAIDKYVIENNVEEVVEKMVAALLKEKPEDPQQWLLTKLEEDMSEATEELSEADLHKLFASTSRITREIVPRDTIDMVIAETMQILNCDIVSLFVLEKKSGMLLLFASNLDTPIKVHLGQGIAGTVFNTKETVNIPDCYKDRRFDKSFDHKTGYVTRSLIAVPILDYEGNAAGVIQAINKMPLGYKSDGETPAGNLAVPFKRNDENILHHLTQHVCIAMRNAEVYREAIMASERSTGLLNTIQSLSQDLGTQSLLLTITMHANKIVSAQRSTVFLVDEPHEQLWSVSTDTGQEIRIPRTAGIAGQCCQEGIVINIPDAYADARFNQAVDKKTGFKTHSILAIPMFSDPSGAAGGAHENNCIGVIQMINKVSYDGQLEFFDDADVEVMILFSKFVGPKLVHSAMLSGQHRQMENVSSEAELGLKRAADELQPPKSNTKDGSKTPQAQQRREVAANVESLGFFSDCDEEEEAAS
eukprot:TRINITY_DN74455_c0_g1_i1.p1 TRINITY_DN74455_c0_g1~~TRINITY_DN74455_c0_g1_i1.p1  ORF type:complete len:482 (+),score=95.63 TRINITY_DN74455_c0_g1_i1:197-1642(+)